MSLKFVTLLAALISFFVFSSSHAEEAVTINDLDLNQTGVYKYEITSNLTMRGWKLSPNIYFGQTKSFGNTSYGLMIDKGDYAYGVMDQKLSITKSF